MDFHICVDKVLVSKSSQCHKVSYCLYEFENTEWIEKYKYENLF